MTDELIKQLEALTGADFNADKDIYKLCFAEKYADKLARLKASNIGPRLTVNDYDGYIQVPAYTASIDAAMTLADPGAGLYLNRYWLLDGEAWSCSLVTGGIPNNPSQTFEMMDAPTPAIALCIAALKARAA